MILIKILTYFKSNKENIVKISIQLILSKYQSLSWNLLPFPKNIISLIFFLGVGCQMYGVLETSYIDKVTYSSKFHLYLYLGVGCYIYPLIKTSYLDKVTLSSKFLLFICNMLCLLPIKNLHILTKYNSMQLYT